MTTKKAREFWVLKTPPRTYLEHEEPSGYDWKVCSKFLVREVFPEDEKRVEELANENANLLLAANSWKREAEINEMSAKEFKALYESKSDQVIRFSQTIDSQRAVIEEVKMILSEAINGLVRGYIVEAEKDMRIAMEKLNDGESGNGTGN